MSTRLFLNADEAREMVRGGLNPGKITDAFDIKRFGVDHGNPLDRFRLQIAGGIVTNGHWF